MKIAPGRPALLFMGVSLCCYALRPAWPMIGPFLTLIILTIPFIVDLGNWFINWANELDTPETYYKYRIGISFLQLPAVWFASPFVAAISENLILFITGWTMVLTAGLIAEINRKKREEYGYKSPDQYASAVERFPGL